MNIREIIGYIKRNIVYKKNYLIITTIKIILYMPKNTTFLKKNIKFSTNFYCTLGNRTHLLGEFEVKLLNIIIFY